MSRLLKCRGNFLQEMCLLLPNHSLDDNLSIIGVLKRKESGAYISVIQSGKTAVFTLPSSNRRVLHACYDRGIRVYRFLAKSISE